MTNIEKVKRIIDAGHWVKVTYENGETYTITSCLGDKYTWIDDNGVWVGNIIAEWSTIEVIQRIYAPYKSGDKVLVLSHPDLDVKAVQSMVWTICTINSVNNPYYALIWNEKKNDYFYFPYNCLAPAFEEDSLSGKEMKIVIDGKEYSATLKLI